MELRNKILTASSLMIITAISIVSYSAMASDDATPPKPTVSDCVERMGLTEEECTEMIEKMKDMKPGEGMRRGVSERHDRPNGGNRPPIGDDAKDMNIVGREFKRAEKMKEMEEKRFSRMKERIEKIIDFFKSKDMETSAIESELETLKNKTSAILTAIDGYIETLDELKDSDATELSDNAKTEKENIKSLFSDLKDFCKNTLKEDIKTQIEKLTD